MIEVWVTILASAGVGLLVLAAAAGAARGARRGRLLAAGSRTAAIASLIAAVAVPAADARLPLLDVRLVAAGLVLAASAIHLALALAHRRPGGLWPVDALVAALLGVMLLVGAPGGGTAGCAQRALPFFVEWALYLFGGGALLVAGGAGAAMLASRGRQIRADDGGERELLVAALAVASVALGGGLLVGTWWAWQTTGTLLASDQRQVWMAVAWVVGGMGLVAGELETGGERWMDGLAVVAASTTMLGLLAMPDLWRLWGG